MTDLVIGAGVIGLAVGRALARHGREVIVAETEGRIGSGISSRNSEVIHGGMYYPTGSLKARLCTQGRERLYAYCETYRVAHRRCGKLVVATTESQVAALERLRDQGLENGVDDLAMLDEAAARRLEPELACKAALLSPRTGIVDSHGLMLSLQGEIESAGGAVALNAPVLGVERSQGAWRARFGGAESFEDSFAIVVNAAGLAAQDVARRCEGYPRQRVPQRFLAKGSYFAFDGKPAFSRLIYPLPSEGGLGVHVTLDLGGRMRFGPDVEWVERESYDVAPERAHAFEIAVRAYWPGLPSGRLRADYAGVRPKLSGPGGPARDFVLDGPQDHGLPGLAHLFGIESPGLTASLALGERVADETISSV